MKAGSLSASSPLSEAKEVLAQMREQNEILKEQNRLWQENLLKAEQLKVQDMLGGRSFAGQQQEKKEETAIEYKNRVLRGGL